MELEPYLESLRRHLAAIAALGEPEVARAAELLTNSLEAAVRLCLMEALSDAAAEITAELDPSLSVELRLQGRQVNLVVTPPPDSPRPSPHVIAECGDVTRVTLRLPESLKTAMEQRAAEEGISVNSWLIRTIACELHGGRRPPVSPARRRSNGHPST